MKRLAILFGVALCGCASAEDAHIYPGLFGQKVVGNQAYVTVSNVWNDSDALPLADAHCRKYNRIARLNRMDGARANFDCVKR
jgi:hypothetical protein